MSSKRSPEKGVSLLRELRKPIKTRTLTSKEREQARGTRLDTRIKIISLLPRSISDAEKMIRRWDKVAPTSALIMTVTMPIQKNGMNGHVTRNGQHK